MESSVRFRATVCDHNGELHNFYGLVNKDFSFFKSVALMNFFILDRLDFEPVYSTFEFIEPVNRDSLGGLVTDVFVDLTFVELEINKRLGVNNNGTSTNQQES